MMSNTAQFHHPLILCVEDNADYLLLRKAILEASGYTVISAKSSAEALRLVRSFPVSLVISDHLLGGMTGADLATEIKKIRKNLPLMLYSGGAPEKMGNVSCFLRKDEPVELFLSVVSDLIKRYLG